MRAIAIDKTGTLTTGTPAITEVIPLNGHTRREVLERAAALEAHSSHVLAGAVRMRAHAEGLTPEPALNLRTRKGLGAEGDIGGRRFWIGSLRFLNEMAESSAAADTVAARLEEVGNSVVVLGNDRHICGLIGVADTLRTESPKAISDLKRLGIKAVVMLTGDNAGTARTIAAAVGIEDFRAGLLPEDKLRVINDLIDQHRFVAMVGDGVNDAPAMAAATLGIAMGAIGSDAALETADIALMADDLSRLPWLIRHSRRTVRIIKANVLFALVVKAIFLMLALGGIATLWTAIAADMGASLLVVGNALRLLHTE